MRRFLQKCCRCWFGKPLYVAEKPAKDDLEIANESYDREEMAEPEVDTTNWHNREFQHLSPYMIKDADLTRELTCGENDKESKIKELGFKLSDDIGKGSFGRVCLAFKYELNKKDPSEQVVNTNKRFACKIMALTNMRFGAKDKKRMADFKNELFTLVKSKHPNIIGIIDHFILNNHCYLVMEFADLGNLSDLVKKEGPYVENEAMDYFAQISSAFYYLHCRLGVAHFDIKLSNILVFRRYRPKAVNKIPRKVKITDFGLSRLRIDQNKGVIKETVPRGTVPYMSPQVLRLYILERLDEESVFGKVKPFNPFIADIWSLGVCLFLMVCRQYPFPVEDDPRLMRNVLEAQQRKDFQLPKDIEQKLTIECKDLIEDCIEPNPHKRLTIQNIVSHIWFENKYSIEELSDPIDD